ncbi:adenylyltransferase/cytidyltransferase family protein [Paenibacillus sp. QZ-Y1]|uniref:adenylyltransferase/cytidyltransferase family protein n=1 Tax=Paenibacillus sp. QZ-Y1 TaxID=3414511 RepID=UPI003F791E01
MIIGYTSGVFDLFHIGHLNLLRNSKSLCDKLIVGVTTDELVSYKYKKAVIPFEERIEIVRNISFVDTVIPQDSMHKFEVWQKLKYDVMFVGDDWFQNERWVQYESQFEEVGVKIIYFPYTKSTSSTLLNETLLKLRK